MAKITIAVGIPALNEEANIALLLKHILKQKLKHAVLKKIIVISDGSTDATVKEVQSVKDSRVRLIENIQRVGQNASQNTIFEQCTEDIVVLLNADILPKSERFLEEIIAPLQADSSVALVGAQTVPVQPLTHFEKVLYSSHMWKNEISREWNAGDCVLSCRGQARAFAKSLYTTLRWPGTVPEDAYSYFNCLQQGFQFVFNPRAEVIFRLPQNLKDHIKQSHRYYLGQKRLAAHIGKKRVKRGYNIPLLLLTKTFIISLMKHHVYLLEYVVSMLYITWFIPQQVSDASQFDMAASSKKLLHE